MEMNVPRMERSVIRGASLLAGRQPGFSLRSTGLLHYALYSAAMRTSGAAAFTSASTWPSKRTKIVAEHPNQLARGLVEVGLVAPGL